MSTPVKVSRYFTMEELAHSYEAVRSGLPNIPTPAAMERLKALAINVLDPIRVLAGAPVFINSGYRSPEVNRRVGGARSSQHMLGEAADIICPKIGHERLFEVIRRSSVPFDQLIDEFGSWCHVSYRELYRRQVLVARKVGGRTVYSVLASAS